MTYQCLNCGSQTRSGAKFCHLCGTPIATTSLPPTMPIGTPPATETRPQTAPPTAAPRVAATEAIPAPTAYISQAPQTYHTPHPIQLPPTKKSGRTFKVILITFAIFIALVLGAVATGVYFVRKTVYQARHNGWSIPLGDKAQISLRKEDVTEEVVGVPLYPGAQTEAPILLRDNVRRPGGSFGVFTFTTEDRIDKVVDFYKEKLGENTQVSDVRDNGKRTVTLNLIESNANKTIVVTEDDGKTKFIITSILGRPGRNRDEERRFEQQMRDQAERIRRELGENIERSLPIPPPGFPPPDAPHPPNAPLPRQ